ncbi:MAG TPA: PAS domain S-box protein [Chitinophagaceae bacterium]
MQAPVAITVVYARDLTIELANACQLRLWGRDEEEVMGKPLHIAYPGTQPWQTILQEVMQSGEKATLPEWPHTHLINGLVETFLFDLSFEPLANERGELERIMIVSTDVTRSVVERRKAEAGAGALHSLANALPQLVWIATPDGTVTYYNDQVAQFTGAEQQADGSWRWEGLLHPEDIRPTADAWQDAVATGKVYEKEHRVCMKDGSWRWYLSRGFPHRNVKGEVIQWYGTATDIHGVKQAEEDLAYQKGLLETVTRNTTGALFMLDSACCLVYQNDAARRMTGYSFAELEGKNLHAHIHHTRPDGSYYPQEECPLAAALQAGRQARGEEVFSRKDGTLFPVYYAVSPIVVEGATVGMVMEVRDATGEKKAQQDLQESEERLRVATTAAGIGTWSYDLVHDVVHASDQYKRLFGLSPHREMTYELFLSAVVEEDRERTDAMNRAAIEMQAGQTDYEWEYRIRGIEDGELRWLRARGKVYAGADGRPLRFAGAVMDITDEKRFTERLEALVRQRTAELQNSNHDLQQFAHVASHDLKEPLRKIRTFASRLAEDKESRLSERGRVYLEKVESAAGRMSNMIEGVLAYSTITASPEAPQPVDLAAVVQDISSDLEVLIQQKDAKLAVDDLPVVVGAPVLIHQLFYNLLNNSLKFARPGVPPRIAISAGTVHQGGSAFAQVVVRDNGIGFGPEHAEAIFGTFTRLNPKDQFEGTGLGLSLCKKIVERHGGTITAGSKEGEGATFTVTLPLYGGNL